MPIEYAISAGEGALVDYGVADTLDIDESGVYVYDTYGHICTLQDAFYCGNHGPLTVISAPCSEDCQTGK